MDFRTANLRIFQREAVKQVFFQPRIEPWFHWHRIFNQLPAGYRFDEMTSLFDKLGCSMRYVHYYTGMPDPVTRRFGANVNIRRTEDANQATTVYETPYGALTEVQHYTVDQTWRTVDFAVKTRNDLKALRWLYGHTSYHFDANAFEIGADYVGRRGVPQFWVPKSPYQALAQVWMKLPDLIYALADFPEEVEETMTAIDAAYDPLYAEIAAAGVVQILNFGENIHEQLLSPRYFERYLLPFWEKRVGQLRAAGVFSHVHLDGYFKNLLPYLKDLPFDGLEALTPEPQGDVSLTAIKAHIGDKILLDGIPAVLFLETYSRAQLLETTRRVIDLFSPNLVLGISDELPQGAGLEAIERVRWIADFCKDYSI